MKPLISFIALAVALNVQSQTPPKVQIGLTLSPDIGFRTLQNNDGSSSSDLVIESRNQFEVPKISYTMGVNARINFTQKFGLETGIHYSNKGYGLNYEGFVFEGDITWGECLSYRYNYHYIDVPIKANFTFGNKKLKFIAGAGLTANFFLHETIVQSYQDQTHKQSSEANNNSFNLSPTVSFGIDYQISDKLHLRLEPTFKYQALKLIDAPVTGHLYTTGIHTTCYWGF